MDNQKLIELAKQAELYLDGENTQQPLYVLSPSDLERFAALVRAAALEEAAGVCDEQAHDWHLHAKGGPVAAYNACAAAIRARGAA